MAEAQDTISVSDEDVAVLDEAVEKAVTEAPAPEAPTDDDGKLHVLYLNHSAQMSGAEASLRALLWQLRRSDESIDPVVAVPGDGNFSGLLRDEGFNVTLAPLRRLHRPRGLIDTMGSLLHVMQTAPYISRLVRQTNSKLVHSNTTTAHLVGGLAAERLGRPAIWHARDLVSLARIAPQLAGKSAKVIAISNCVKAQLEKDGVPADKITVIYNGVDPYEWHAQGRSYLRESLSLPDESFVFGMVGQLVPWKNHVEFIEAAAKLAQDEEMGHVRFAIIGGDIWGEHKSYVKELRTLVKEHHLVERFNFIPHQSDGVDAMMALDCLVHPSLDEPFGRVVMEGMCLRKPVIAMAENGPGEIVTHEHDGLLVRAEEENGLPLAMKRIYEDVALREHLAENARPSVEEKFHIADSAQQVMEVYKELVG